MAKLEHNPSTSNVTFDLPGEGVYPEGITLFEAGNAFLVSGARSGDIFRGDLATGRLEVFISGEGREPLTTVGLDVDTNGRLWVAGGASGNVYTFDATSGEALQVFETAPAPDTFINDLVVAPSGAVYVTDSLRPYIFRIAPNSNSIEAWLDLTGSAFEASEPGSDSNGIVVTPDERYLIAVKTGTGELFRIDIAAKEVSLIDLSGESLTGGDGLILEGPTLYVVRNSAGEVVVVELVEDLLSGQVSGHVTDPSFEFPTTAVKHGDDLLVVNSQFDRMDGDQARLPFRVSRVRV